MTALSPLRLGRITGSRVSAVLGLSPHATAADVLREMVRQALGADPEFVGNVATSWGNEHESDGIAEYELMHGVVYGRQQFVIHPLVDWLAVTIDGRAGDGLVEVKAPYRALYMSAAERPDYVAQMQLQMTCTGAPWTDLMIWRPDGVAVSHVSADPWWLETNLPALEAFMATYRATIADPELAAPHLAPLVDERTDEEWQLASLEYLEAFAAKNRAESMMQDARDLLQKLAGGKSSKGCGVSVNVTERAGSVDYKKALAATGAEIDLDAFRKASSIVTTVRAVNAA